MSQPDQPNTETSRSNRFTNRRRVLQSLAVLGVGGTAIGSAQSRENRTVTSQPSEETPIAVQQFAIRNLGDSAADHVRRVAEAGYDAIEFYSVDDMAAVQDALDETGLDVAGIHLGLDNLEGSACGETVAQYTQLDTTNFVVASVDDEFFQSEDGVLELADRFDTVADLLDDQDLDFVYHNHTFEYVDLDGRSAFDLLAENTNDNVLFQIDTGLTAAGGVDPVSQIERLGERVDTVHMRDMYVDVPEDEAQYVADGVGYDFAEIGAGDLDMRAIATAARNVANVDFLIYEHNTEEQAATLETGADVLSTMNSDDDETESGSED